MALRTIPRSAEEQNLTIRRFADSRQDPPADLEARRAVQAEIQYAVLTLAHIIDSAIEPGRETAVALTTLQEVQMWANKGVFA